MTKILIARGHHPLELSALVLARRAADLLSRDGSAIVEQVRMPFELSFLSYLMNSNLDKDSGDTSMRLTDEIAYGWHRQHMENNPESMVFSFHNSRYLPDREDVKKVEDFGFSEYDLGGPIKEVVYLRSLDPESLQPLNGYTIEVPALYKPVDGPELLAKCAVLREKSISGHALLAAHTRKVDLVESRNAGLMSRRIEDLIVDGINCLTQSSQYNPY